jgi:DoxX-like family
MDAVISQSEGTSLVKWKLWVGRVVSALPILGMTLSAAVKLSHQTQFVSTFVGKLGYPEGTLTGIGLLELTCVALYAIPRTKVLGAVLLTGYLGGAIATHVRIGEPFVVPLILGALAWLGLYLRDEKVRALSPLRS